MINVAEYLERHSKYVPWIGITLSAFALTLSGISFYRTQFLVSENVELQVLGQAGIETPLKLQFAVSNLGTRTAVVLSTESVYWSLKEKKWFGIGGDGRAKTRTTPQRSLAPGEVALLEQVFELPMPPERNNYYWENGAIDVGLVFSTLSVGGQTVQQYAPVGRCFISKALPPSRDAYCRFATGIRLNLLRKQDWGPLPFSYGRER
jgi:hypothetical protein